MKAMKWLGFCGVVLLAGAVMWTTTGCDDDNGSGGGTVTVIVTNAAGEETSIELVAPQQVSPTEGEKFGTLLVFGNVDVEFSWTAVPNADSYMLYVNDVVYAVVGTSQTVALPIGNHRWRVHAVANGQKGPLSPWVNFEVELRMLQMAP